LYGPTSVHSQTRYLSGVVSLALAKMELGICINIILVALLAFA
jgi:hypothetical protein